MKSSKWPWPIWTKFKSSNLIWPLKIIFLTNCDLQTLFYEAAVIENTILKKKKKNLHLNYERVTTKKKNVFPFSFRVLRQNFVKSPNFERQNSSKRQHFLNKVDLKKTKLVTKVKIVTAHTSMQPLAAMLEVAVALQHRWNWAGAWISLVMPACFTASLCSNPLSYQVNWLQKCRTQTSPASEVLALAQPGAQCALMVTAKWNNMALIPGAAWIVLPIINMTLFTSFIISGSKFRLFSHKVLSFIMSTLISLFRNFKILS